MTFTEGDPDEARMVQPHELREFVDQVSDQLAAEYARIRRRAREDPGTAGDEGEENWRDLFEDWLPGELQIVTKGRILGSDGTLSPQVDVIVLRPGYPRSLRNKKTYLAGGVLAAFESKLTLRAEHIPRAIRTAKAIHSLVNPRVGSPYSELNSPILYGLLAHRTQMRRDPIERIDALLQTGLNAANSPAESLGVLCVADLATWRSSTFLLPKQTQMKPADWEKVRTLHGLEEEGGLRSLYMRWKRWPGNDVPPRPLYLLIQHLLQHAAWEIPIYRELARYWTLTSQGGSTGVCARSWPFSVLSPTVSTGIRRGRLTSGEGWSPWGMVF
jgi:hypothetical protein